MVYRSVRLLPSKTMRESPVHQVTRLPACDTAAKVDGGLGSRVLETVVSVSSTTSTLGCAPEVPGRYTAVLFSQTASTTAPAFAPIPGSATTCCWGSSSSLPARKRTSRRWAWFPQISSTDTIDQLAAASP